MEILHQQSRGAKWLLIAIIILAAIMRFWGLERGDPMNDEVTYAFRAIGLVDSFNDPGVQSTPWDWMDPDLPAWTKFSFHDHPPLVFWIQNLFMRLFGENRFAFRLASAIFGIASVFLLFLVAHRLYSPAVGLISASILALTLNHVYVSRVGLQESYVIFFILLAFYLFLRAFENDKYLILTGLSLGLGLLTKYTAGIIIPIFITYLLLHKRHYLLNKNLWLGMILALAIFSPVIIYNIGLYKAAGHFDLQFSYLLDKLPEVWAKTPGKDIGSFYDRLNIFLPRLGLSHSWIFLTILALAISGFLFTLIKNFKETLKRHSLLIIALGYLSALVAVTGPAFRFLTLLTPFMVIAVAVAFDGARSWFDRHRLLGWHLALAALFSFEAFYSINNQILYYPIGPRPWLSSALRYENYNWGYNALDDWLDQELKGKIPAMTFETKYKFIGAIQDKNLKSEKNRAVSPYPLLIITYGNFDLAPQLWIFERRLLYHGWPIMSLEEYLNALAEKGSEVFGQAGFKQIYLIMQTNIAPSPEFISLSANITPIIIRNPRSAEAFRVYKL